MRQVVKAAKKKGHSLIPSSPQKAAETKISTLNSYNIYIQYNIYLYTILHGFIILIVLYVLPIMLS